MFSDKITPNWMVTFGNFLDRVIKQARGLAWGREPPDDWEATFDAIDDWICIIDTRSSVLRSNKVVEQRFGIPVKEAVGLTCCSLAHGTKTRVDGCPLPRMLISGKRESAEIELANGQWVLVTVDPVRDAEGRICGAVHIARDITQRILIQNEREILVKDLKQALCRIKTLSGLIPICSSCKKIRDDKGYWNLIESYVESHSHASFSHSLCPDCMDDLYGQEPWFQTLKNKNRKN